MRRVSFIPSVMLFLLAVSAPAEANWLAWLEEFSGAGPFTSNLARNRHATLFCRLDTFSWAGIPDTADRPGLAGDTGGHLDHCWYLNATHYRSVSSRGFPEMKAVVVEGGVSIFLAGPFELGAGGGFIRFEAPSTGRVTHQPLITPVRLQIRPLFFVARNNDVWWRRLANAPKYYVRWSAIIGKIDASQFGVPFDESAPPLDVRAFKTDGELVSSYGFVIDLGELAGLIPKFR